LALLGQNDAASMADTAVNPKRAITAYTSCRDEIMGMINWPSCTKRALLKNLDDQAVPWTLSHRYEIGDRVTNDTAKTYQCTAAGVSAAAGGPTGTTSGITDGTVTWTYVQASTALNNWCHWPLKVYAIGDLVTWDVGKVYACITAGTTAAATPPTGVTADITDGTVHWAYYGTPPHNRTVYGYQYVMPPDCLRIIKVPNLAAAKESDQGVQYLREGNWLYCDQDESPLKYVSREEDPTRWGVLLVGCVAARIAVEIALAVTGQKEVLKTMFELFGGLLRTARMAALHEGAESTPEVARWEDA